MSNCEEITALAEKGLSVIDIALILNINPDVFKEILGARKEEYHAYLKGIALLKAKINERTIELAQRGSSTAISEIQNLIKTNLSDAEF